MFKLRAKSSLFKKPYSFKHIGAYFVQSSLVTTCLVYTYRHVLHANRWLVKAWLVYTCLHVLHALRAKRSLCKAWCACMCQQWHAHTHTHTHTHALTRNAKTPTHLSQSPAVTEGMRQTNTPLSKFNKPTLQIRVWSVGRGAPRWAPHYYILKRRSVRHCTKTDQAGPDTNS